MIDFKGGDSLICIGFEGTSQSHADGLPQNEKPESVQKAKT